MTSGLLFAEQILTCVTVPLAPIQLMTGIYGMNFDEMPELHDRLGYVAWWIVSISLSGLAVILFYRNGFYSNVVK